MRQLPHRAPSRAALWLLAALACAGAGPLPRHGSQTHLPLPRFASLKTSVANLRRGPGLRYPIAWVYHRRHLPVLILRELDNWRLLRLPDGTRGWMHRALLSGRRSFVVTTPRTALRRAPHGDAAAVAWLRQGVVGTLRRCATAWCIVATHGYAGFIRRAAIWGSDRDAMRALATEKARRALSATQAGVPSPTR